MVSRTATPKTRKNDKQQARASVRALDRQPKRSKDPLPRRIFAQVSPRSIGGLPLFDPRYEIHSKNVRNFLSEREVTQEACARLREHGFDILYVSPLTINIAGSAETYRRAFKTDIIVLDKPVIKPGARIALGQFIDSPETRVEGLIDVRGTRLEGVVEGVALEQPVYYMASSIFPPPQSYWHLRVPADVSLGCNADRAHRAGGTGRGIRVAMVDSGWYRHPYFTARGYRVAPVVLGPGATDPLRDESGHGTGESANIFANAPDAVLMPVKMSFVNSIGAFNRAVALNPHIITCSWGGDVPRWPLSAADQALAASIAIAVARGITVIFSAGNGQYGFPGQHPDVISAGGVFMDRNGSLRASDYASGFVSDVYRGRCCPDVSGLVGMKPKATYIMLPVEARDEIDGRRARDAYPEGDETTASDGWAAFSGTSAAAPQLAGVAALVKQVYPAARPAEVRDILCRTARDVTAGRCNTNSSGAPASAGPDIATGYGLVDAHKALMLARLRAAAAPRDFMTPSMPRHRRMAGTGFRYRSVGPLSAEDVRTFERLLLQSNRGTSR